MLLDGMFGVGTPWLGGSSVNTHQRAHPLFSLARLQCLHRQRNVIYYVCTTLDLESRVIRQRHLTPTYLQCDNVTIWMSEHTSIRKIVCRWLWTTHTCTILIRNSKV